MISTSRLLAAAAIPASTLLLLASAMPVAAVNNSVYFGYASAVTWTPTASYSEITGLSVPAGTWLVMLTATVDASVGKTSGTGYTVCDLVAGSTELDNVPFRLDASANSESVESIFLTGLWTSASSWSASFRCQSD